MNINQTDNSFNVAVISNISFEPYCHSSFQKAFFNIFGVVSVLPVDLSEFACNNKALTFCDVDLIAVIPNFETMYLDSVTRVSNSGSIDKQIEEILAYFDNIYSKIRANTSKHIVWFGFEDYYTYSFQTTGSTLFMNGFVDKINTTFANTHDSDLTFIDTKRLIAKIGINNAYDMKNKYRWNSPYSKRMIECICEEIYKHHLICNGKTKKCLVLDCDNVLWGGIISEDGIENIRLSGSGLGRMYKDFQLFVLGLYKRGVILAICSKNDLSDVMKVFREHSEMLLKEENVACFVVNWNDKPCNMRKISKELNIELDSMVFVDDSPEEIAAVKAVLPEVLSIRFYRDMDYSQFSCFNLKNHTDNYTVQKRNETYRTNKQREELKLQFERSEDYLNALDVHTDIHLALPMEYNRISELTQRTNKCNNGVRFTVRDIKQNLEDKSFELYSVYVSDKFSDLGLVGAFAIKDDTLILFSLSCRALGRGVEDKMLEYIVSKCNINKAGFSSTGKNNTLNTKISDTFPVVIIHQT